MVADENLDLRSQDDGRFLLPLILHRSPPMEPTLSAALHSGDSSLINSLGRQCSHFRVTPNSRQHEHRSERSTEDPVSRLRSITNICVQQRTQVFQRSNLALPTFSPECPANKKTMDGPKPPAGNFTLHTSLMRDTNGHEGIETFCNHFGGNIRRTWYVHLGG